MKVARPVEAERRGEIDLMLAIKLFDQPWRRREAQMRFPVSCLNQWKADRLVRPRVIQIEMESASDQKSIVRLLKKLVARFGGAQIFFGFPVIGIQA